MAHTYEGFDPFTPPSYTAGKGRFISGTAADDGDKRTAAYAMNLALASMDGLQWLAWRTINIIEGGSYNNAPILFEGPVSYSGPLSIIGGATLYVGYPFLGIGHIHLEGVGSSIDVDAGGAINITSSGAHNTGLSVTGTGGFVSAPEGAFTLANLTTSNIATLNVTTEVRTGPTTPTGLGAYSNHRPAYIGTNDPGSGFLWFDSTGLANLTIDATQADVWEVGVLDQQLTILIGNSSTSHQFTFVQYDPNTQAFNCLITRPGGSQVGKLFSPGSAVPSNVYGSIDFRFRGSPGGGAAIAFRVNPGWAGAMAPVIQNLASI